MNLFCKVNKVSTEETTLEYRFRDLGFKNNSSATLNLEALLCQIIMIIEHHKLFVGQHFHILLTSGQSGKVLSTAVLKVVVNKSFISFQIQSSPSHSPHTRKKRILSNPVHWGRNSLPIPSASCRKLGQSGHRIFLVNFVS